MAGLGRKVFTAGDVLTASDVQNYLMDQTVMNFAGTAARSSAIATPTTGMTTYNQTTQQLETYNGSDYVGMSGLQLVKKQTIGTAVSSVSVTNAFSATYDNYKIIVNGGTCSSSGIVVTTLTGSVANYYNILVFGNVWATPTATGASTNNGSAWNFTGFADSDGINASFELQNPFLARQTNLAFSYVSSTNAGTGTGVHKSAVSYTGFTLTPAAGTLTGGTIYVYGYGV
jgi:hypothetical protein